MKLKINTLIIFFFKFLLIETFILSTSSFTFNFEDVFHISIQEKKKPFLESNDFSSSEKS